MGYTTALDQPRLCLPGKQDELSDMSDPEAQTTVESGFHPDLLTLSWVAFLSHFPTIFLN